MVRAAPGLWDLSNAPNITSAERDAFEQGYRVANAMFADAIVDAVAGPGEPSYVMIHDYHLYLVGELVRARRPDAFLTHFVHIPWPQPDCWRVLPSWLRQPVMRGLLGNDLVAFQTAQYARNFLTCCHEFLGLHVDVERGTVMVDGRVVQTGSFPISVDVPRLEAMAASPEVIAHKRAVENVRREYLILRVDRTDLSKNILPRISRLRRPSGAQSRLGRPRHLPRPAAAEPSGRARVRRVQRQDPQVGR